MACVPASGAAAPRLGEGLLARFRRLTMNPPGLIHPPVRRASAWASLAWVLALGVLGAAMAGRAGAQVPSTASQPSPTGQMATNTAPGHTPTVLTGVSETGQPIDLARWRGKVVMVYAWRSACSVCLSAMPELRNNLAGWQGQPFELVSINTDTNRSDLDLWHRLRVQSQPKQMHWPSLWVGDVPLTTTLDLAGQLPAVWVLDKSGQVRFHARGRMPAEAWNQVADLL